MLRAARSPILLLLAMAVLGACSSYQRFRPREAAMVPSPTGHPAAQYELGEADRRVGRINVWSAGADYRDLEDGTWTAIHLGLEITNTSEQFLSVAPDEVELRQLEGDGRLIDVVSRSSHIGSTRIAPQHVGRVEFEFLVERDLSPTSIRSFAARWVVRNEGDGVYRNLTLFNRDDSSYRYVGYAWGPPYSYYGYWWYPHWRYGWYRYWW